MGSLQENSDKLIERIEGHLVSCKDQVERDLLEARTSREVLDDRRMHCIQFQQENHITRVIREKPNLLCRDLLTQNCDNITNPPSAEHWQSKLHINSSAVVIHKEFLSSLTLVIT